MGIMQHLGWVTAMKVHTLVGRPPSGDPRLKLFKRLTIIALVWRSDGRTKHRDLASDRELRGLAWNVVRPKPTHLPRSSYQGTQHLKVNTAPAVAVAAGLRCTIQGTSGVYELRRLLRVQRKYLLSRMYKTHRKEIL